MKNFEFMLHQLSINTDRPHIISFGCGNANEAIIALQNKFKYIDIDPLANKHQANAKRNLLVTVGMFLSAEDAGKSNLSL